MGGVISSGVLVALLPVPALFLFVVPASMSVISINMTIVMVMHLVVMWPNTIKLHASTPFVEA